MNYMLRCVNVRKCVLLRKFSQLSKWNCYTNKEQKAVLQILNDANEEQLQLYNSAKLYITDLIEHRSQHGKFSSLSSVLEVNGLDEEMLHSLCQNILDKSDDKKKTVKTAITPILPPKNIQDINRILAINVNGQFISWVCLDRNLVLHNWEIIIFQDELKNDLNKCYELACNVFNRMPHVDLFVLEQKSSQIKYHVSVRNIEITAYLKAFLTCLKIKSSDMKPCVITMKESAVIRLFNLGIGGERVSGQDIVKNWLNGKDTSLGQLQIDKNRRLFYEKEISANREHLSNILLLGVAFLKLVLLKDNKFFVGEKLPYP